MKRAAMPGETTEAERDAETVEVRRRPGLARRVLIGFLTVAALALLAWQVQRAGPAQVLDHIGEVSLAALGAVLALTLARYVVAAARLAAMTARLVQVHYSPYLSIVLVAQMLGIAIPGIRVGATVLRAHLAARRFGGGTAVHIGPNLLDQIALALSWLLVAALLLPFPLLAGAREIGPRTLVYLLGALASIVIGFLAFRRHRHRLVAWLGRPRTGRRASIARAGREAVESMGALADDRRALTIGVAGGVTFVLLAGLTQHVTLLAVGSAPPWWISVLAVVVGTSIGTASGSPGGLGVTEAAQVAFLEGQGVPLSSATAAVLLARGAYYAVVGFGGLSGLAWELRRGRLRHLL